MSNELVSVVMATYNGERYLRQQLDSILEQSHQRFELIVVDDASTDGTLSILEKYAALDDRIQVFRAEKNLGLVANFQRGLMLVNGDYIALADQDDIFHKDKIGTMLAVLKAHPRCDLAVSDLSLVDEEGNEMAVSMWRYQKLGPMQGKPFRRLLIDNFATGCAMMFRHRLLKIALPFPPECLVHDWWLAVVAASAKGGGICLVKQPLTAYRQHRANVIGAKEEKPVTVNTISARIQAPPRGLAIFNKRTNDLKPHIARLGGYLCRDDWSVKDRLMIEETKDTLEGYLADAQNNLWHRLTKLPQRLRCAATTGSLARCLVAVYVTIWPLK